MNNIEKLQKQIDFIAEVDKLKNVLRYTSPIGMERKENSAEHSWHVVMAAMILLEYANEEVNLLKVVKMLAIHDIVEIDVGDTFHFHKSEKPDLYLQELAAAERIFGLLDSSQKEEYLALWKEFESRETIEAQYAIAIDRIIAFIINSRNKGGTWAKHNITVQLALEKNSHIEEGSRMLWEMAQILVNETYAKGYISQT